MMQKISGILPPNERITKVDISAQRPLRQGTPSFGLPVSPGEIRPIDRIAGPVDRVSIDKSVTTPDLEMTPPPRENSDFADFSQRMDTLLKNETVETNPVQTSFSRIA